MAYSKMSFAHLMSPLILSLAVASIFTLPNILGYIIDHPGKYFSGQNLWFDPWDVNVYVSVIRWSQNHGLYFQNTYTTIPHKPVVLYPLYTLAGIVFKTADPQKLYHILTFVSGVILSIVIYFSSYKVTRNKKLSVASLLLTSLGGGFGWLVFKSVMSPDLYVTPFTFTSIYQKPHESIFAAASILTHINILLFAKYQRSLYLIRATMLGILSCIFYPYFFVSVILVFLSYYLASKTLKIPIRINATSIVLFATPLVLFTAADFLYLSRSTSFENIFHPNFARIPLPHLLLGYGALSIIPILALAKFGRNPTIMFFVVWFLTNILLSQTPIGISKYFLRGLFFPLVTISLLYLKLTRLDKTANFLYKMALISAPATSLVIFLARIATVFWGIENQWVFLSQDKFNLMKFLQSYRNEAIIANYPLSNLIPAWSANRVYAGHSYQTPNFTQRQMEQDKILKGEINKQEAKEFMQKNNISIVISTNKLLETLYPFLVKKYENPTYALYIVN